MPDLAPPSLLRLISATVVLAAALSFPAAAQDGVLRDGAVLGAVEAEGGVTIYSVHRTPRPAAAGAGILPLFSGDSFSLAHQLGVIIEGIVKCLGIHQVAAEDNTVSFDGLSELLAAYLNGTQPLVFEFETPGTGPDPSKDVFM
ncbi:MAG: hypothetical protein AAFY88_25910, partial [Acidobacteriota bacterium]